MANILNHINDPVDLQRLTLPELEQLASEIREEIIGTISQVGGHFAPGLGAVEITLAFHSTLNSPYDKIIWDVGHQSYPHKLITGRRERFHTIKQMGGISGYCKRAESKHDIFEAGHGGTSVSAALGFAKARDLRGSDETIVAVIGDGSLTAGMAQEALNNAGRGETDLIIILNDNQMAIAPNVGGMSKYFARVRSEPHYLWAKREAREMLRHIPMGERMLEAIKRVKGSVKQLVVPGVLFEDMGLTYLGPVDGHCLETMREAILQAKRIGGPVLIHALTTKGKGYEPAEKDPYKWHATGKFDPITGEFAPKKAGPPTYSKVFTDTLIDLAGQDEKIVAINAAMPDGTGLNAYEPKFPDRYFDVGMCEQHAVTFAAGMAADGFRPFVAIYSTFLQRAFDQIIHDVCIMNFPVRFCIDRAGITGNDGPTHQGAFDIAYMRPLPNMILMAPKDEPEFQRMLVTMSQYNDGPIAVRYPRGAGRGAPLLDHPEPLTLGIGETVREGGDLALIAYGYGVDPALAAANYLAEEGIEATVINARFAKPLDEELILSAARDCGHVVTIEDGVRAGGFGSAVQEMLQDRGCTVPVLRLGLPDQFIEHGDRDQLLTKCGLDADGLFKSALEFMRGGVALADPISTPADD